PNSMLLYADPSYLGVDGNMIIFGHSGNRYVFYLRSETFNTDKITQSVVDVVVGPRWTPVADGGQLNVSVKNDTSVSSTASMPFSIGNGSGLRQNASVGAAAAGKTNSADVWKNNVPMDPEGLKFDLDMFLPNPDDVDIAPDNVWRDNIFTYIDLGPKALTMTQRPVVSLLVQGTEVPVGFRTRGANSRLIVVEAIGDMVLRNGQKVICIKLRRDPAAGLEYTDYSGFNEQPYSYLQQLPNRAQDLPNPEVTLYGGTVLHGNDPYVPAQNGGGYTNLAYATETGGIDPYAGAMNPYCTDTTGANRCGRFRPMVTRWFSQVVTAATDSASATSILPGKMFTVNGAGPIMQEMW
ncbi:MAG: TrbG/VirB9 family P-type conjugative transfer protein, partial [Bacteroidales bacterium]|nr:TrbG/VirB9 family P-type conjugative transfer protein [Bacteroidales bacterium]